MSVIFDFCSEAAKAVDKAANKAVAVDSTDGDVVGDTVAAEFFSDEVATVDNNDGDVVASYKL